MLKFGKINIDENTELANQYGIMSIPTIIILKNGEVENTFVGVTDIDEIRNALK